jgi:hypothetical protein
MDIATLGCNNQMTTVKKLFDQFSAMNKHLIVLPVKLEDFMADRVGQNG